MESRSCPSWKDNEEGNAGVDTTEGESRVTAAPRHLLAGFADGGRRHEPRNAAPEAGKGRRQLVPGPPEGSTALTAAAFPHNETDLRRLPLIQ